MIALLRDEGLLSEERIALLLSWRHSGFSAHNAVRIAAGDRAGVERLGRYLLRSPVAVERLELLSDTGEVLYHRKDRHDREPGTQSFEPAEFLAQLLQHIPEPRLHQVRYYGRYSNAARARRSSDDLKEHPTALPRDAEPDTAERRRARRGTAPRSGVVRAQLIRRVYEVDLLTCQECGGEMRILAFLLDPLAIHKILAHLERQPRTAPRGPPVASAGRVRTAP